MGTIRTSVRLGPFELEPILVPRVWGGTRLLRELHPELVARTGLAARDVPDPGLPPIGESWEVSDVGDDPALHSRIRHGAASGRTLREIIEHDPAAVLGASTVTMSAPTGEPPRLPLLFKFIDARECLSVQVHPSDEMLHAWYGGGSGKSEAWVILDAEPGASVAYGLADGWTYERYLESARRGAGGDGLRWVTVRRGDIIHLPAGTLHAIGAGVLLAEIQQSSDVTYRLHDWGRLGLDGRPRELHLDLAARVTPPASPPPCPLPAPVASASPIARRVTDEHFAVDEIHLAPGEECPLPQHDDHCAILAFLGGAAAVVTDGGEPVACRAGHVLFFPAEAPAGLVRARDAAWALWLTPGPGA